MPPLQRSVSTSRQFIVYGTDAAMRGALCATAERAKSSVLALLQQPDHWKTPIVVNANSPQANLPEIPSAALNFSQTGFGLKLQLDLTIAANVNAPTIERELLRVLLIEMMYRNEQNLLVGTPYVQPPDWLLDGVLACGDRREPAELGDLLEGFTAASKLVSLEEFVCQRTELLDSPSRAVYRAYSFALVTLLTDSPNGHRLLAKFITDLPQAPNDASGNLRVHFPALGGSRESAEKVWRSGVMRLAALETYQPLTVTETECRLDDLLHLRFSVGFRNEKFWSFEDNAEFMRFPNRAAVLNQLNKDLMLLGTRANPVYRPVIAKYQQIAMSLARGKTRGISRRLGRLKNSRQILATRMQQIDDYMNWFEATQSRTRSGTFAEYLRAARRPEEAESRRRDPISVYIDTLESQFRD